MNELSEIFSAISHMWGHKLITIQGVKLSLGNVSLGLLLLLASSRLAKICSRLIVKKAIEPFVPDKSVLNTYQTLASYICLTLFVLLSLTVAGIPLTIFTVIGGALAIGVGFGSQNIVNNFISGLIMMIEQPAKIGDVVEIDGVTGTVTDIGTRSTKVKTGENKHYIIPNSFFLEKSMMNWTLENSIVRADINLGVAYGSDPDLVKKLIVDILDSHNMIEKHPAPMIIFDDFGDNSLMFKIFFWLDIDKIRTIMEIKSELRFQIDRIFKKNGLEFSYPQRDIHLRSVKPLEVTLTSRPQA